jgi:hypothetical protein
VACTGVTTTEDLVACAIDAHRAAADALILVEYGPSSVGGAP